MGMSNDSRGDLAAVIVLVLVVVNEICKEEAQLASRLIHDAGAL